jgi:transposase
MWQLPQATPDVECAMLAYKAENAGRQLLKIDPEDSSQECPNCHAIAKKALSKRVHRSDCSLTIGRDHAAALVILGVDYACKRKQRGS